MFLGSNIGNLVDELATEFIYQLGSNLFKGDKIILGVDLKKPKAIVLPAYNDSKGVTAEFNLNLLDRINKELGANFNRAQFEHAPTYDEHIGIAKSYIKSKIKQSENSQIRCMDLIFHLMINFWIFFPSRTQTLK